MNKWKCEICNSEFDNFQAQGFNNKIYCPLCYYKELYGQTELERERLNNIINELEKYLEQIIDNNNTSIEMTEHYGIILNELLKLKELRNKNAK